VSAPHHACLPVQLHIERLTADGQSGNRYGARTVIGTTGRSGRVPDAM
jgi:hypothetical protein